MKITIPDSLKRRLVAEAATQGADSASAYVTEILERVLPELRDIKAGRSKTGDA